MIVSPEIHPPSDGRGARNVYVNGSVIANVVLADERRGRVVYYPTPIRLDKHRKRILTKTLRGEVVVKPIAA